MLFQIRDYDNINVDNFELSQVVMDSIHNLESLMNLEKKESFVDTRKITKSWNSSPPKIFQKTTFLQNVSEEDKIYNEIRNSLNKLSSSNYDTQMANILVNIEKCEDKDKVVQTIYTIACSNKVFSELYAKLYKELVTKYDYFADAVSTMLDTYKTKITSIRYKDPNVDYDLYCAYTKTNDSLRASLSFYVNLFKYDLLKRESLVELIMFILDVMETNQVMENRRNEMEEFAEQLFILCKNMDICLCDHFAHIKSKLEKYSKLKNGGEVISMSSRVNFRCMDILDGLK